MLEDRLINVFRYSADSQQAVLLLKDSDLVLIFIFDLHKGINLLPELHKFSIVSLSSLLFLYFYHFERISLLPSHRLFSRLQLRFSQLNIEFFPSYFCLSFHN